MSNAKVNMAASVKAKLLTLAKETKRPYQELLQYFAMERFLYRFSQTRHAGNLALKGALMLQLMEKEVVRSTKDIDVLAKNPLSESEGRLLIEECITVEVEDDGIQFDLTSIRVEAIRHEQKYKGIRCRFRGFMENTRADLQVDVGFGDAAIPSPVEVEFPTLLDFPAPRILVYSIEAAVSEKYEAIVSLGSINTRLKDFYDIWFYSSHREFEGTKLTNAIRATFERRGTKVPADTPEGLLPEFHRSQQRQTQWKAFLKQIRQSDPTLNVAVDACGEFLLPPTKAIVRRVPFLSIWVPGEGWQQR